MRTLEAIFVLIGRFLGSLFTNVFSGKKLIFIILIIAAIIFFNQTAKPKKETVELPAYQKVAPAIEYAPNVLQTYTRVYYVSRYVGECPSAKLYEYYVFNKDKWEHYVDNENPLEPPKQFKMYKR